MKPHMYENENLKLYLQYFNKTSEPWLSVKQQTKIL